MKINSHENKFTQNGLLIVNIVFLFSGTQVHISREVIVNPTSQWRVDHVTD